MTWLRIGINLSLVRFNHYDQNAKEFGLARKPAVKLGRRLTLWLPPGLVAEIKSRAAIEDRPASLVVADAVAEYLRRRARKGA